MELTEDEHQRNRNILTELITDAPLEVVSMLTCYNYDENAENIYNQLSRFKKAQLQEAAIFLQQPAKNYKYKDQLVRAIISRIDSLLLEHCPKCELKYSVNKDDIPILSCINCGQGCHYDCYKDIVDAIKLYPGIHYQCHRCVIKTTQSLQSNFDVDSQETHKTPNEEQDSQEVDTPLTPGQPNHTPLTPKQPSQTQELSLSASPSRLSQPFEPDEQRRPICQRYIRGNCPHGILGQTLVNGEKCFFSHPKRCMRFCRNGPYSRFGCNKGRDCEYMHPILCKFSLKYRKCTNLRCKFTHLKFTQRYENEDAEFPPAEYNTQENVYTPQQRHTQENSSSPQRRLQYNHPETNQSSEQNHFLEQLPDILYQIQQDLKQLKQQQNTHPPSPPVPMYAPAPNISPPPNSRQPHQITHPTQSPPADQNNKMMPQLQQMPARLPAYPQANNQMPTLLQQNHSHFPSLHLPTHH